jgi:hypothetical protein
MPNEQMDLPDAFAKRANLNVSDTLTDLMNGFADIRPNFILQQALK